MYIDRSRNGIAGATGVVAVVAFIGILQMQYTRAPALLHYDTRIVIYHSLFVVPENKSGRLR